MLLVICWHFKILNTEILKVALGPSWKSQGLGKIWSTIIHSQVGWYSKQASWNAKWQNRDEWRCGDARRHQVRLPGGLARLSSGPSRGQQRPPCRLQLIRAPPQATERADTSTRWTPLSYPKIAVWRPRRDTFGVLKGRSRRHEWRRSRSNMLHGCWGWCSRGDGMGDACFRHDMTDAAHCAADRTSLTLHDP